MWFDGNGVAAEHHATPIYKPAGTPLR